MSAAPTCCSEKWYGWACHLIVGKRCAYHLGTRVGPWLVSTVGAYYPNGPQGGMEAVSGLHEDGGFYETMVFPCDGETPDGDPNILDWEAVERRLYRTSKEAEDGHYELLAKYRDAPE